MKTYFTVYKITNIINGNIYIGCHKTKDLDDDYMGSGKRLKNAIKKYGIENFKKEILFIFDTSKEMFDCEALLVNEDFISRKDTYNLKVGGHGGWDYIHDNGISSKRMKDKVVIKDKNGITFAVSKNDERYLNGELVGVSKGKNLSEEHKSKISKSNKGQKNNFKGKSHSEETKKKMSEKAKIYAKGKNNSQFGTMWITNGSENKKIFKLDIIPDGWKKGRILK